MSERLSRKCDAGVQSSSFLYLTTLVLDLLQLARHAINRGDWGRVRRLVVPTFLHIDLTHAFNNASNLVETGCIHIKLFTCTEAEIASVCQLELWLPAPPHRL